MDWSKPVEVRDLDIAFPANVVGKTLPPMADIPESFQNRRGGQCESLVSNWFFEGLKEPSFYPREGVDPEKAIRQIKTCLGSFEPKHEHKEAGVAYLLNQFFERVDGNGKTWEMGERCTG